MLRVEEGRSYLAKEFNMNKRASEPVAYRFNVGSLWFMCSSLNKALETVRDQGPIVIEPLFTTPQPAPPCPRYAELERKLQLSDECYHVVETALTAANQQIASDKLLLDEAEKAFKGVVDSAWPLIETKRPCQELLAKLKNRGGA